MTARLAARVLLLSLLLAGSASAVQPDEMLADPALEARARVISRDLRCLVCQNQSIDDSDADLARDLRLLLRQRLLAGDSDSAARQFLVDRYGDYVLLQPPVKPSTLLLWGGPVLLLLAAAAARVALRRRNRSWTPLTEDERARLDPWLKDDQGP